MADLQDTIRQIMGDPEAMRQVQSLGEQLGLSGSAPAKPAPPENPPGNAEMMSALAKLAPMMNAPRNDEITALLNALQPFLGEEKRARLQRAQRLVGLLRMIPLLKKSGLFSF